MMDFIRYALSDPFIFIGIVILWIIFCCGVSEIVGALKAKL